MGTEFGALSTALSALQAERQALSVTGQNIANANTAGYTRQRVNMQAIGGSVVPAMYSTSDGIGDGVQVSGVQRLQDAFLEQRANTENGTLSNLEGSQQTYSDIENSFGEPSDDGIQNMLSTYWNDWDTVANNPSDTGARTTLIGDAQSLASGLNTAANSLASQWTSSEESLGATVAQINTDAINVAKLNEAIINATNAGNSPNDLEDQRDELIRDLASQAGVTTKVNANGSTDVFISGSALVSGSTARQLQVSPSSPTALDQVSSTDPVPSTDPVTVTWADNGASAGISTTSGGVAGGYLLALNTTIPTYNSALNKMASDLAAQVNTQQAAGYDINGNAGAAFFGATGGGSVTAANIAVTLTAAEVAASSVPPSGTPPMASLDGGNAQTMAKMSGTGADLEYRKMIVQLGSESASVQQQTTTQQSVVTQVEASRDSESGVDIDEEQTNLITFQQAYNAAAQYTSVIDQVLDTLINKMLAD